MKLRLIWRWLVIAAVVHAPQTGARAADTNSTDTNAVATNVVVTNTVITNVVATKPVVTNKISISFPKPVLPKPHHLFRPDGPPLWRAEVWSQVGLESLQTIEDSLKTQRRDLEGYFHEHIELFAGQAGLLIFLGFMLGWLARVTRQRSQTEEGLRPAALAFRRPYLIALLLALFAGWWIYPNPPPLWQAVQGAAMIIPAVVVLSGLVERKFLPALILLVVFYFIDQVRRLAGFDGAIARLLLMGETTAGAVFFTWMLNSRRFSALSDRESRAFRIGAGVLVVLFASSSLANICGGVIAANVLGRGILASAYVGLILIALHRFVDALISSALNIPPLGERRMISENRAYLQAKARRLAAWAAIAVWIYFVLGALSIRHDTFLEVEAILAAEIQIGKARFTLGNFVAFGLAIWIATIVSSVLRFTLREEIYPRVSLGAGLQYSISKMVHYAALIIGLLAGITALGVDLTHITILVSALSVGLGFGLQNIVNNFVSGIILLFERPIKVGDFVDLGGGTQGVMLRIGIRASIMRMPSGAEVIIPNGNFISNNVTNWTLSGRQLVLSVAVALAPPVDAPMVLKLLEETAAANRHVLKDPAPEATLINLVGGFLTFQMRAWAADGTHWIRVRSELSTEINAALTARNFTLK